MRRRGQPLPDRHRRGGRARAHARARGTARSTRQHNTAVVDGGEGAADLARAVVKAAELAERRSTLTYPDDASSLEEKIDAIATKVYGADGVEFLPEAQAKLKRFNELGYGDLPICMAKTHLSISHDPALQGRAARLHGADPRPARLHRRRAS